MWQFRGELRGSIFAAIGSVIWVVGLLAFHGHTAREFVPVSFVVAVMAALAWAVSFSRTDPGMFGGRGIRRAIRMIFRLGAMTAGVAGLLVIMADVPPSCEEIRALAVVSLAVALPAGALGAMLAMISTRVMMNPVDGFVLTKYSIR